MVMGENGIFVKANKAKENTNKSQALEDIKLKILEVKTEKTAEGETATLKDLVEKLEKATDKYIIEYGPLASLGEEGEINETNYTADDTYKEKDSIVIINQTYMVAVEVDKDLKITNENSLTVGTTGGSGSTGSETGTGKVKLACTAISGYYSEKPKINIYADLTGVTVSKIEYYVDGNLVYTSEDGSETSYTLTSLNGADLENGKQYNIEVYGDATVGEDRGTTVTTTAQVGLQNLTIGTATNASNYGNVVTKYTQNSQTWRLFFQDSNYTYLICDSLIGSYNPSEHYDSNATGESVGFVGQKLSTIISSLFTSSNTNDSIKATAWLTDPSKWSEYTNQDAVFAIGSPTAELFAASYNATGQGHTITLEKGTNGYIENTGEGWLSKEKNGGVYNKDGSSTWWLASPYYEHGQLGIFMDGSSGYFDSTTVFGQSFAVRPVVCIPTSVFNSKYN